MKKFYTLLFIFFFICNYIAGQYKLTLKDITVLKEASDTMMRNYLTNIVERQFAARDSLLSGLKSKQDWEYRAQTIKDSMISWTGKLPARTPLNARITGRLDRNGYIIEKILFESRPGYFVSGNLYLPKNYPGPRPALLNVIGHSPIGKADLRYQYLSVSQAKNGFVVLTIDGLGQGERQVAEYASIHSAPGNAHQVIGTQAFLSGTHVFNFMVWDAIRAIDYLVSRQEVDPENICITGSSGGGMMSTYILPFDDRIKVSVPVCNPNTWNYRVRADLATDHEQVFFGAFQSAIDPRGDPLFTHVPKPLLLNTTNADQLNPPGGVWDLSTWLFKAYAAHGKPEMFNTTMVRAAHDYNREQREITYSWMLRWTGGKPENLWEEDIIPEKEEDLWTTTTGNVFNEKESRSDQELVLDYLHNNKAKWSIIKNANEVKVRKETVKPLIEDILNTNFNNVQVKCVFNDIIKNEQVTVNRFILEPETGIVLPGILLEPAGDALIKNVILYLHEKGKSEILNEMHILTQLLKDGYCICAVDLRGTGETAPDMAARFWDFLAGKPIFSQRVYDILALVKWLKSPEVNAQEVKLWGTGLCALYGAFAGSLTGDISCFLLEKPLISFESVVKVRVPVYNHQILLPGILEKFDMTQIYQTLSPRSLAILNPVTGDNSKPEIADLNQLQNAVLPAYKVLKREKDWKVLSMEEEERSQTILKFLTGK